MIPQTFPSVLDSSNRTQMVIYMLPSITGLTKWIDYIPVKSSPGEGDLTLINRYEANGYIYTTTLSDITGKQAWKDYIPVYIDSSANTAWSNNNDGYIPMSGLAALLLDFTTGRLDPRINFYRTSNATITNSAGAIAYAPHNLLTYSEQFDNAAITKVRATISANSTTAPDGTITADKLVEDGTVSNTHACYFTATTVVGTVYTYSVYVKAAERTWIMLGHSGKLASFNLSTGVLGTVDAGATATITPDTNGFYKCSISLAATGTSTLCLSYLASGNNTNSYNGDGVSGVYIWGAHLEIGTTATTYNSTTVKNLLGYSELFDNAAWTKSNSFVQTNQLIYSQDFSNAAWVLTGTASKASAPTITYAGSNDSIKQEKSITATSTTFTFSIKLSGSGTISLGLSNTVDDVSRTQITLTSTPTRYSITKTFNATASSTVRAEIIRLVTDNATSVTVAEAQLVQGSVAGDYRRTNAAALPIYYANHNGVVCAEKLVENTATNKHFLIITNTFSSAGSVITYSAYVKQAEKRYVYLSATTGFDAASVTPIFDTQTGTWVSKASSLPTLFAENAGNGWWRIGFVNGIKDIDYDNFRLGISNGPTVSDISYTGDGTSGIYIFGAQLLDSASLDPYVLNAAAAPSAAAYYGPRFDYDPVTLQPKGLLIEEQRANLVLNSTIDGASLATQNVTVTAQAYTLSFYGTGQIVLSGTASATVTGTGAYPSRKTLTFTPTAGTLTLTVAGTVQYAQLEAGTFATSYIPTGASQATRTADVATVNGSNFYSWYNQNEGSYSETADTFIGGTNTLTFSDGTNNNRIASVTGTQNHLFVTSNSVTQADLDAGTFTINEFNKLSAGYKQNNFGVSLNNSSTTTDTDGTTPIVNRLNIGVNGIGTGGFLNGHIKSIAYYNTRLSDSVLKGLTA